MIISKYFLFDGTLNSLRTNLLNSDYKQFNNSLNSNNSVNLKLKSNNKQIPKNSFLVKDSTNKWHVFSNQNDFDKLLAKNDNQKYQDKLHKEAIKKQKKHNKAIAKRKQFIKNHRAGFAKAELMRQSTKDAIIQAINSAKLVHKVSPEIHFQNPIENYIKHRPYTQLALVFAKLCDNLISLSSNGWDYPDEVISFDNSLSVIIMNKLLVGSDTTLSKNFNPASQNYHDMTMYNNLKDDCRINNNIIKQRPKYFVPTTDSFRLYVSPKVLTNYHYLINDLSKNKDNKKYKTLSYELVHSKNGKYLINSPKATNKDAFIKSLRLTLLYLDTFSKFQLYDILTSDAFGNVTSEYYSD